MNDAVLIIAEAGVNHNGSLAMAMELVDAAASAGADLVKFQTFSASRLVTAAAAKAEYQSKVSAGSESQLEMLQSLELSYDDHVKLIDHCRSKVIGFFSTGFDTQSVDLLVGLGLDIMKIPSGEITNLPYLRHMGSLGKKLILSTGMASMGEIDEALIVLESAGTAREHITILHCTTEYPAPMAEINLRAMLTIRDAWNVPVGYSDHSEGIEVSIAAVAMGARIIEKHFTLDRNLPGPDHQASLEPAELQAMVQSIRNIELALGTGVKRPSQSEQKNKIAARKSLVAARAIAAGERFSEENLAVKRPGSGLSPMRWEEIVGRIAPRSFTVDELIEI
ncbi:MAG: N-acetylneuraminate synthase [Halioglobus sp.]